MFATEAKITLKKYIKNKHKTCRIELCVLADSNSYTVHFSNYTGKSKLVRCLPNCEECLYCHYRRAISMYLWPFFSDLKNVTDGYRKCKLCVKHAMCFSVLFCIRTNWPNFHTAQNVKINWIQHNRQAPSSEQNPRQSTEATECFQEYHKVQWEPRICNFSNHSFSYPQFQLSTVSVICSFSYPQFTTVWKKKRKNSVNKQSCSPYPVSHTPPRTWSSFSLTFSSCPPVHHSPTVSCLFLHSCCTYLWQSRVSPVLPLLPDPQSSPRHSL